MTRRQSRDRARGISSSLTAKWSVSLFTCVQWSACIKACSLRPAKKCLKHKHRQHAVIMNDVAATCSLAWRMASSRSQRPKHTIPSLSRSWRRCRPSLEFPCASSGAEVATLWGAGAPASLEVHRSLNGLRHNDHLRRAESTDIWQASWPSTVSAQEVSSVLQPPPPPALRPVALQARERPLQAGPASENRFCQGTPIRMRRPSRRISTIRNGFSFRWCNQSELGLSGWASEKHRWEVCLDFFLRSGTAEGRQCSGCSGPLSLDADCPHQTFTDGFQAFNTRWRHHSERKWGPRFSPLLLGQS